MKNRNWACVAGFILAAALFSACASTGAGPPASPKVHHTVICWLKEPGDARARQEIVEVSRSFTSIPGVIEVAAGPVLPSDRPIVDSSFDVAITITFTDKVAMAAYLAHPLHQRAVEETIRPLVRKILAYDFLE